MGYYIDLEKITLSEYKIKLVSAYLPPSRIILKERLDERFAIFEEMGIKTVHALIQLLKKKDKLIELSKFECLSGDYLIILLRELNSIHPKPNKIADFIDISKDTVEKLKSIGVYNTEQLYSKVIQISARQKLAESVGIDRKELNHITKLTDLSRIKYVGVTFAHMLYILGVDTAKKASESDPVQLHDRINLFNKDKNLYKGQIGLNDIRIFVNAAKDVSLEMEYENE